MADLPHFGGVHVPPVFPVGNLRQCRRGPRVRVRAAGNPHLAGGVGVTGHVLADPGRGFHVADDGRHGAAHRFRLVHRRIGAPIQVPLLRFLAWRGPGRPAQVLGEPANIAWRHLVVGQHRGQRHLLVVGVILGGGCYGRGLFRRKPFVDESIPQRVLGKECNGRSVPACNALLSCSFQRSVLANHIARVSEEPGLIIDCALSIGNVLLGGLDPRIAGAEPVRLAHHLGVVGCHPARLPVIHAAMTVGHNILLARQKSMLLRVLRLPQQQVAGLDRIPVAAQCLGVVFRRARGGIGHPLELHQVRPQRNLRRGHRRHGVHAGHDRFRGRPGPPGLDGGNGLLQRRFHVRDHRQRLGGGDLARVEHGRHLVAVPLQRLRLVGSQVTGFLRQPDGDVLEGVTDRGIVCQPGRHRGIPVVIGHGIGGGRDDRFFRLPVLRHSGGYRRVHGRRHAIYRPQPRARRIASPPRQSRGQRRWRCGRTGR